MSVDLTAKSIEKRLETEWDELTPIDWDNGKFAPPKNESWIRLTIIEGQRVKADVLRRFRAVGVIMVQVFVPLFTGTRAARALAEQVAAIFNVEAFEGVVCDVASVIRVGDTGDGWFQVNVSVPFRKDEAL